MIPPVLENCISVPAGPVRLVVEARQVTEENGKALGEYIEDYGPSLHVFGTKSGSEYLRFDCFDRVPHYHYIKFDFNGKFATGEESRAKGNSSYRFDQIALGDPIAWTFEVVRTRLPEMLDFVDQPELAEEVRANMGLIAEKLVEAHKLFSDVADKAEKRFIATVGAES